MGSEADCDVRLNKQTSKGRARLEEKELLFRGDFRLKIPFGDVKSIDVKRGVLKIAFSGGEAAFDLGPDAEKWAEKVRNPRGLLDKLGVKPGVVWAKGQKAFREDDARAAGPAAGLVDVKVASFSETLSALRMVIPVKDRTVLR